MPTSETTNAINGNQKQPKRKPKIGNRNAKIGNRSAEVGNQKQTETKNYGNNKKEFVAMLVRVK